MIKLSDALVPQVEASRAATDFLPPEPASIDATGLPAATIEALVLKLLLTGSVLAGRQIADALRLPLTVLIELLRRLKTEQIVAYKSSAGLHDYEYELTPAGFERATRLFQHSSYHGATPVPLADYIASLTAQSPTKRPPRAADLHRALDGLVIDSRIFGQIGEAISAVGALFLYGSPGNGKTSVAERLTSAFGPTIWIPRVIDVDGEFIQIFDPMVHAEVPVELHTNQRPDQRWIHIRRPTIVAGGELTLENLEIGGREANGVVEAPLHLKSNCGTLVIDDFGRQRVRPVDLLNRWIIPLEKRYDYLTTPAGRKIQVPFNQMIVFATNLEPKELVDEAFLRRIPYKIEIRDPTEDEFRRLCRSAADALSIEYHAEVVDHLIETHYRVVHRPFRFCHPRDLFLQVRNHCNFHERKLELTNAAIDSAVANYFVTG
jgi:predicted ATPase with chaperone activity